MNFVYKIETLPSDTGGYNILAYTEGTLEVWQGDTLFLRADGILLVEFAVFLEIWRRQLDQGEMVDLYYASMDFEEEPIFALVYDSATDKFTPASVWSEAEGIPVSASTARKAVASYIESLDRILAVKGVNLRSVINNAIKA